MAAGILLFLAFILLRDRRREFRAIAGAAFLACLAMYIWCSIVHARGGENPWMLPLYAGCFSVPFSFYIFTRSLFEDDFKPRMTHLLALSLIVAAGYVKVFFEESVTPGAGYLHDVITFVLQVVPALITLLLVTLAILRVTLGHRNDLVESRRRFRRTFVTGIGAYAVIVAAVELWLRGTPASDAIELAHSIVIAGLTIYFGQKTIQIASSAFEPPKAALVPSNPEDDAVAGRLKTAMEKERLYQQEAMTIGRLAGHLNMQEYKLRRLINHRLGYRNFNDFLNSYRIDAAAAILATEKDAPILRIAMDLGFGSLAPFNRAFKAGKGMTPTEFRRSRRSQ